MRKPKMEKELSELEESKEEMRQRFKFARNIKFNVLLIVAIFLPMGIIEVIQGGLLQAIPYITAFLLGVISYFQNKELQSEYGLSYYFAETTQEIVRMNEARERK